MEGDNYIEVCETEGLLIPNAVTLIKAEGGRVGLHTTGFRFNSERRRRGKKNPVIYLALLHVCSSACNLTELKRKKLIEQQRGVVFLTFTTISVVLIIFHTFPSSLSPPLPCCTK